MILLAACAPAPDGRDLAFDGPAALVRDGDGDQHHATVAVGPDGRGMVTFSAAAWIVAAPLGPGARPGPSLRPFGEATGHHPQVAAAGDGYWLVGSAPDGLAATWLGPDGAPGPPIAFAGGRAMHPDLALTDDVGLVAWSQWPGGVRLRRFTGELAAGDDLGPVPLTWDGTGTPSVDAAPDGWRLVWAERGDGVSGVRAVALGADGAPRGPSEAIDAWTVWDDDARPDVAAGPSGHAIAWRRPSTGEAWLAFFDADGAPLPRVALHDAGAPAGRPALDAVDDVLFAVWEQGGPAWRVVLGTFDLATGAALGPPVTVARDTGVPGRPAIAVDGDAGRGVVSWEAAAGDGRRAVWVRGFRLGAAGAGAGGL